MVLIFVFEDITIDIPDPIYSSMMTIDKYAEVIILLMIFVYHLADYIFAHSLWYCINTCGEPRSMFHFIGPGYVLLRMYWRRQRVHN